jgi:DNA polymerase-3 subunit epsilon
MSWNDQLIHFVDFEGSIVSGVLEYGVVSLRGGNLVPAGGRFCRPAGRVRAEETAVHGLAAEALAGCAPFADEFDIFSRLRETGPLAAHFANAENTLIKATWPYPRAVPDFTHAADAGHVLDWGPWIDTGRLYTQTRGDSGEVARSTGGGLGLAELVAAEGLQARLDALAAEHCPPKRRHYHAALYDALAGALLLTRLAALPAWGDKSLRWLIEHSTLNAGKREILRQGELF